MGVTSHAKEVTQFECSFRGSPRVYPTRGSQSLTHTTKTGRGAREGESTGRTTGRIECCRCRSRLDLSFEDLWIKAPSEGDIRDSHLRRVFQFPHHGPPFYAECPPVVVR